MLLVSIACVNAVAGTTPKIFDITFDEGPGGSVCTVAFFGKPPPPNVVDKIVRSALESAVLINPSKDIVAMAFLGDDSMNSTQYSGTIAYKASAKRIMTMDEFEGIKATIREARGYFVQTKEDKTFEGIKPEEHWLSISIVFPNPPTVKGGYDAAISEVESAANRGMDVNVTVYIGDKSTRTSWKQLEDNDAGDMVFVEYSAANKTIKHRGRALKQLR